MEESRASRSGTSRDPEKRRHAGEKTTKIAYASAGGDTDGDVTHKAEKSDDGGADSEKKTVGGEDNTTTKGRTVAAVEVYSTTTMQELPPPPQIGAIRVPGIDGRVDEDEYTMSPPSQNSPNTIPPEPQSLAVHHTVAQAQLVPDMQTADVVMIEEDEDTDGGSQENNLPSPFS